MKKKEKGKKKEKVDERKKRRKLKISKDDFPAFRHHCVVIEIQSSSPPHQPPLSPVMVPGDVIVHWHPWRSSSGIRFNVINQET